jgi:hypothetical protein
VGHGAQTVFPGSVHKDTGEEIAWEENGEPVQIDGIELRRYGAANAAFVLLARYCP